MRRFFGIAVVFSVLTWGQGAEAALMCQTSVASVPLLNQLSTSAAVGEIGVTCSGGDPVAPLPLVNFRYFYNVGVLNTATPILSDGTNDFLGDIIAPNQAEFLQIPFDPVASAFSLRNIFINPSQFPPSGLIPSQVLAFVSATGTTAVPIINPQLVVATIGTVPEPVPEPATLLLLGTGLAAVGYRRRRKS